MSEHMPEDMPKDMPKDLPVRKCINVIVGITRSKIIFDIFFAIFIYLGFDSVISLKRKLGTNISELRVIFT